MIEKVDGKLKKAIHDFLLQLNVIDGSVARGIILIIVNNDKLVSCSQIDNSKQMNKEGEKMGVRKI